MQLRAQEQLNLLWEISTGAATSRCVVNMKVRDHKENGQKEMY